MIMKRNILLALILILGTFVMSADKKKSAQNMKKLMNAEFVISEFYVDSIDDTKLVEDAIRGMLNELDPHSSYSTAEETR